MKPFHFSKTYFNTLRYDESKIRVIIKETPSLEISEEEYSLRVETFHEDEIPIHRNYAIEHHNRFDKHNYPHLQFKFHTEEIGSFWLRLNIKDSEEYRKAILGFIYKIKNVLIKMEKFKQGICEEIMVLELVNELTPEGEFLSNKISESITEHELEFQEHGHKRDKIRKLKENSLLIDFLGEGTINTVVEVYENKNP